MSRNVLSSDNQAVRTVTPAEVVCTIKTERPRKVTLSPPFAGEAAGVDLATAVFLAGAFLAAVFVAAVAVGVLVTVLLAALVTAFTGALPVALLAALVAVFVAGDESLALRLGVEVLLTGMTVSL